MRSAASRRLAPLRSLSPVFDRQTEAVGSTSAEFLTRPSTAGCQVSGRNREPCWNESLAKDGGTRHDHPSTLPADRSGRRKVLSSRAVVVGAQSGPDSADGPSRGAAGLSLAVYHANRDAGYDRAAWRS